jgi:integrase
MPAAYGEGIVRSAVPSESGAMTEQRDLSVFWVRCEKVTALWSQDNTPSYGPDWSATFYEYRVSVKEALYASAGESESRELCVRSLINLDQDAAIMKEGREYLIWGSTRRDEDGSVIINIRQKKTGAKVSIPVSSELKNILERYDYQLPHLEDQVINRYMKDICRLAGLDEIIAIQTTKGGKAVKELKHKWELVQSHTARRTGATLMYLSGMDFYDIMRITGHTSPTMLKKYIKADSIEVADKITDKYSYFD